MKQPIAVFIFTLLVSLVFPRGLAIAGESIWIEAEWLWTEKPPNVLDCLKMILA